MRELVFLLEEKSAKAMLESLLPRMLDPAINTRFIPFDGKQDLEKQMVRKLRGYLNPQARFIVMRDLDCHKGCKALKTSLVDKCREAGKQTVTLVRIACKELESFYLADLAAVEKGLNIKGLAAKQNKKNFKAPDRLGSPKSELKKLTTNACQYVGSSREIGRHLDIENTRSTSFGHLIKAIRHMETELLATTTAA